MAIERIYFKERNFVLTLIYGNLTDIELEDHVQAMNREYSHIAGIMELADCRYITDVSQLSGKGVLVSAQEEEGTMRVKGGRGAIVASSDVVYGLARMYAAIASNIREDSQAFRTMDEAIAFLGIQDWQDEILPILSEAAYRKRMGNSGD